MVDGDPPSSAYEQLSGLEYRHQRAIAGNGSNQNVIDGSEARICSQACATSEFARGSATELNDPAMFAALAAMSTR